MNLCLKILASFFLISSSWAFVPGLLEHGREMVGLIEKARLCSIDFNQSKEKVELCTGLVLKKNDLKFLKELDLNSCKQFLKQMKYRLFEVKLGDYPKKVPKKEVDHFFSSTKLALILHPERAILFKRKRKEGTVYTKFSIFIKDIGLVRILSIL